MSSLTCRIDGVEYKILLALAEKLDRSDSDVLRYVIRHYDKRLTAEAEVASRLKEA